MHRIEPKIALVFPGVGSQHTNMAKSFYDHSLTARNTFEEASDILNIDMAEICFSNDYADKLNEIDISQLSLVAASIAIYRCFQEEIGIKPYYYLGHSLGEYSALCAAGVITFPDTLKIVKERGRIIKETIASCDGTMIWVINVNHQTVEEVCKEYIECGEVYISAYDSPTQCSISGKNNTIKELTKSLEGSGAIVYPLKMSGPFHSPFMAKAADEMEAVLREYRYAIPECEVISNYSVQPYHGLEFLIDNLSKQLISPIQWQKSVVNLVDCNVKYVIEIGPNEVLKFLIKKTTSKLIPYSFNRYKLCDELKNMLFASQDDYQKIVERCLKVATSTRNYNSNYNEYLNGAVLPYRAVEKNYRDILDEKNLPSESNVMEAIEMAVSVMEIKKTPKQLFDQKLQQILQGKALKCYIMNGK